MTTGLLRMWTILALTSLAGACSSSSSEGGATSPALCYDHPAQGYCDCRAYICRTSVKSGRCSCGLGAYDKSTATNAYTEGCTSTKGVCCVDGAGCECGMDKCDSTATAVASCDAKDVLETIAPTFEAGGAKRTPTCSP